MDTNYDCGSMDINFGWMYIISMHYAYLNLDSVGEIVVVVVEHAIV